VGIPKIIKDENFLRQPSAVVTLTEGKLIAKELQKVLKYFNTASQRSIQAIGLSAPQIGILKCVAIIAGATPMILINPNIIHYSDEQSEQSEGCLSFPHKLVTTKRAKSILLETENMGATRYNDFLSIVIQHEVDHLSGVLFYDRATTNSNS